MKSFPIVEPNQSIKECMVIIDKFAKGISYIADKEILEGICTDGDIRRALLDGASLEDPISSIMNKDFVSFNINTESKVIRERFSNRIRHIPLIDDAGVLLDIADPQGNYRISVLEPLMQGNELKYVTECIETNWISSQGRFVNQFEMIFEDFHNGTNALAVSNGTVALHLALISLGVGSGDEVIVPDITFAACANAVIYTGASPVFCEIDPDTWCIDTNEAKKLITASTKAIMAVHLYGQPCNMDSIKLLCDESNLLMVEDCAEALGSEWKGKKVGTFGDAATFSFFGNKTISTGEGGMILFKNSKIADRARTFRDHGMSKAKRYWHDIIGYNYRLTNIQAAIGVAQMEKFNDILEKKLKICSFYDSFLNGVNGIKKLPSNPIGSIHSNWLYGVVLDEKIDREKVGLELQTLGIETRPFFYSLSEMPPYRKFAKVHNKIAKKVSENGLSLPSSVSLSIDQLNSTLECLISAIENENRKTTF